MKKNGIALGKESIQRIEELREGIFSLHTRRFGTVAELIIMKKYNLRSSNNQHHDATDARGNRVEIKFSRILKSNSEPITPENLIESAIRSTTTNRVLTHSEANEHDFDSNIQQIKRSEFDILYYGLFFADKIAIFSSLSEEIENIPGYSDFQHKGNEGEGQFHIHNQTIDWHMENNFVEWITYKEVFQMFQKSSLKD